MTVLNKDETDKINEVVDYIILNYQTSVGEVKQKYHLTKAEYDMISELMMPAIRWYNEARRLKAENNTLKTGIAEIIDKYKYMEDEFNAKCFKAPGYGATRRYCDVC